MLTFNRIKQTFTFNSPPLSLSVSWTISSLRWLCFCLHYFVEYHHYLADFWAATTIITIASKQSLRCILTAAAGLLYRQRFRQHIISVSALDGGELFKSQSLNYGCWNCETGECISRLFKHTNVDQADPSEWFQVQLLRLSTSSQPFQRSLPSSRRRRRRRHSAGMLNSRRAKSECLPQIVT